MWSARSAEGGPGIQRPDSVQSKEEEENIDQSEELGSLLCPREESRVQPSIRSAPRPPSALLNPGLWSSSPRPSLAPKPLFSSPHPLHRWAKDSAACWWLPCCLWGSLSSPLFAPWQLFKGQEPMSQQLCRTVEAIRVKASKSSPSSTGRESGLTLLPVPGSEKAGSLALGPGDKPRPGGDRTPVSTW